VDIARRLGVSQATVSLVVSGGRASDLVAEKTRRAVLETAAELGYAVNPVARSLKSGRNRMLGLCTFEPVFPVDLRDFYAPFLLGVEEVSAECGYDVVMFSSLAPTEKRRFYACGVSRLKLADGCILLGRNLHRDNLAHLVHVDVPLVFVGKSKVLDAELSYVAADYVGATADLVRNLAELGHRRLAYL
jgi:DNA-binding LacI/PurR family transcriptional regulator